MHRFLLLAVTLLAGAALSTGVAACGGSDSGDDSPAAKTAEPAATTATAPATTRPKPPPRIVEVEVDGDAREVDLNAVTFPYCRKRTAVCSSLEASDVKTLSPVAQRAVAEARKRQAQREAQEAAAARAAEEAARQQELEQQAPEPVPQEEPEGTGTG
ncbi:MAG: hypothetical protein ACR2NH_03055 [Solirubrobacteraceae bacterium]